MDADLGGQDGPLRKECGALRDGWDCQARGRVIAADPLVRLWGEEIGSAK